MEQKDKCLKVFEWVYGIKIHVLGKELFCTQLFAFAAQFPNQSSFQKGVRIIYCESGIIPLLFYAPINGYVKET